MTACLTVGGDCCLIGAHAGSVALSPLDRLACVGERGMGALVYAPEIDPWDETGGAVDLDRPASETRCVRRLTRCVSMRPAASFQRAS